MAEDDILQEEITDTETASEPQIYTGPNIFAMALQRFQVFRGGLPPYVRRAIEKLPDIEALIVPVSELEDMRRKIDRPGTNEARLFSVLQQEAEKLNKERRRRK